MTSPLCFGQLSVWRSIETNPLVDGIRSQLTSVLTLPAGTTEQQVRAALSALWRRHEGLRTTFELDGGEVRQVVHPSPDGVVEVRSLDSPAELERSTDELFARPFALTKEFGWQVRLMTFADGTSAAALAVHHILADRWALRLLLAEFHRMLAEPGTALGPPALTPAALARQQRSDAWAARRAATRNYLNRLTEGFPRTAANGAGTPGKRLCGSLDLGGVAGVVSGLADRFRVTAQTVLLALFALGVTATTGRDRLLVHLMVANRLRPEWHDLVTSMNQLAPAGIVVAEADTVSGLLRQVQAAGLAAMRNGCHDVDDAAAATGWPPGSSVDHVLNYLVPAWPDASPPDDLRPAVTIEPSTRPAIADIYGVVSWHDTPVLSLHADSHVHPADRLRRFLAGTDEVLRLLSTGQDPRIAELSTLY
jgi:phage shock protein PspC (stress-responsive transcriptional regulator)